MFLPVFIVKPGEQMMKLYKNNWKFLKCTGIGMLLFLGIYLLFAFNAYGLGEIRLQDSLDNSVYFKDFTLQGLDGEILTDEDIRSHKLTIVNGWAPWCTYCVAEMPDLSKLAEEYREQDVLLVGVVADYCVKCQSKGTEAYNADIRTMLEATGITYPSYVADEAFYDALTSMLTGLPATWAVTPDGEILEMASGSHSEEAWRELIDGWIQEVSE